MKIQERRSLEIGQERIKEQQESVRQAIERQMIRLTRIAENDKLTPKQIENMQRKYLA